MKKLFEQISSFKRPLFVIGNGLEADDDFLCDFPFDFVTTIMAKKFGEKNSNKRYYGTIGILGDNLANDYLKKSDLLICVGTRLSERTIMNDESILNNKILIYINIGDNFCHYNNVLYHFFKCDANIFLSMLKSNFNNQPYIKKDENQYNTNIEQKTSENLPFTTANAIYHFFNSPLKKSFFCLDDGQYTLFSLKFNKYGKIVFYGTMAAGGSSLGSAIGASVAIKNNSYETVVIFVGDGGLLSVIGELQTIKKYNLNIVIAIFNNGGYESIRQWFPNQYSEEFGYVDFSNIACAFDILYRRITSIDELFGAINYINEKKELPIILDLVVESEITITHFDKEIELC